jgi:hypothetical protein
MLGRLQKKGKPEDLPVFTLLSELSGKKDQKF